MFNYAKLIDYPKMQEHRHALVPVQNQKHIQNVAYLVFIQCIACKILIRFVCTNGSVPHLHRNIPNRIYSHPRICLFGAIPFQYRRPNAGFQFRVDINQYD